MGNVYPSGWQTTQYDSLGEDRYLYNRSHVIGFMLCGDNATPENLFTGTQYLNTGGMVIFELEQIFRHVEALVVKKTAEEGKGHGC